MKKNLKIIILFICQNVFCQEYNFDNFYEFEGSGIKAIMINSQDDSYYFTCKKGSETIWGYLFDFKENSIHNYEVIDSDNSVQFNYLNSRKMTTAYLTYIENNIQYDSTTEVIDSIKSKTIITKNHVNKRGKKRFLGKIELEFDGSNNVFPGKLIAHFGHHFFDSRDLSFIVNKLPNKIIFDYNNGIVITNKLIKKLKINTILKISTVQLVHKQ